VWSGSYLPFFGEQDISVNVLIEFCSVVDIKRLEMRIKF